MSIPYKQTNIPLSDIALKSDGVVNKLIINNEEDYVNLSAYQYNGDENAYCKTKDRNSKTWGIPLSIDYQFEQENIKLIDKTTAPCFFPGSYQDATTKEWITGKQFVANDTSNAFIAMKCIPFTIADSKDIIITYNHNTSRLLITSSEESEPLLNVMTSPYIIFDIQSCGGNGGDAATGVYQNTAFTKQRVLASGGGGGAGGFASFSATFAPLDTNDDKPLEQIMISIKSGSCDLTQTYGGAQSKTTMTIEKGTNGQAAQIRTVNNYIYTDASLPTFSSARGGHIFVDSGTSGNNFATGDKSIIEKIFMIDCIRGASGGQGCGEIITNYNNKSNSFGAPSSTLDKNTLRWCSTGPQNICYRLNATAPSEPGYGYWFDQSYTGWCKGGGGGAPSIVANGMSYYETSAGIGAGGIGGTAYSDTVADNDLDAGKGSPGGGGMIWIYYVAPDYWCRMKRNGHKYTRIYTNPTCTENGTKKIQCSECEHIISQSTSIPALGHAWGETQTLVNNCIDGLKTKKTCRRCAESVTNITPGRGYHDDGVWETDPPTCATSGIKYKRCSECRAILESETIPATGNHAWQDVNSGDYYYRYCSNCGKEEDFGFCVYYHSTIIGYLMPSTTGTFTYYYTSMDDTTTPSRINVSGATLVDWSQSSSRTYITFTIKNPTRLVEITRSL